MMKTISDLRIHSFQKIFIVFISLTFTLVLLPYQAQALIPDLSQTNDVTWQFYCAPTSAANSIWDLSAADPALMPFMGTDDQKANAAIMDLANRMNTNVGANGTTVANMKIGLEDYLTMGSASYSVLILTAFNTGPGGTLGDGQTLWNAMQTAFSSGAQVLPLISFSSPPGTQNDVENELPLDFDETNNPNPTGHAVTMTGSNINQIVVNDPGNNALHNWVAENALWDINPGLPTSMEILSGPYTSSWIVGAVTISAVPEPSSLLLIGSGLIGIIGVGKRFRR